MVENITENNKTLYSSPYMVMNEREYTKHYFIEGERVCSKLGSGFALVHDPTQTPVDPIKFDYKQIPKDLWEMVARGIACVEFNPENVKIEPDLPPAYNLENATEADQFFYHSDHLGSSSFITNINGAAVQHLQYLPFGETYVDQRHDSPYNTPYKFSGKEKDDETQYSYFGARYYDSDLSVWLSVDPLSDKKEGISAYNYCHWNPVVIIDPDGRDDFEIDKKTGKINRTSGNKYYKRNDGSLLTVKENEKYIGNEDINTMPMVDRLTNSKGDDLYISGGTISRGKITNEYTNIQFQTAVEAAEFYYFAAESSEVEWCYVKVNFGNNYLVGAVGTNYGNGKVSMPGFYEQQFGENIELMSHSHYPDCPPSYDVSQDRDGTRHGDLNEANRSKYNYKREVYSVPSKTIYEYSNGTYLRTNPTDITHPPVYDKSYGR